MGASDVARLLTISDVVFTLEPFECVHIGFQRSCSRGGWSHEGDERSAKKITFWLLVPLLAMLVIMTILLGLRHHHLGLLDWLCFWRVCHLLREPPGITRQRNSEIDVN
jgi:hypothetical protein